MLLWWVNLGLGSVVFIRTWPKDGGVVDAELELGGPRVPHKCHVSYNRDVSMLNAAHMQVTNATMRNVRIL